MIADGNDEKMTHEKLDAIYSFILATFFLLVSVLLFVISGTAGVYLGLSVQLAIDIVVGVPLVSISLFAAKIGFKRIRIVRTVEHRRRDFDTYKINNPSATPEEAAAFLTAWDRTHIGMTLEEAAIEGKRNPIILKDLDARS